MENTIFKYASTSDFEGLNLYINSNQPFLPENTISFKRSIFNLFIIFNSIDNTTQTIAFLKFLLINGFNPLQKDYKTEYDSLITIISYGKINLLDVFFDNYNFEADYILYIINGFEAVRHILSEIKLQCLNKLIEYYDKITFLIK